MLTGGLLHLAGTGNMAWLIHLCFIFHPSCKLTFSLCCHNDKLIKRMQNTKGRATTLTVGWSIIFKINLTNLITLTQKCPFRLSQSHNGHTCDLAPARHCRLCFRFQVYSVIRRLAEHQWLVALQLMSQCHKYSFYVVIIIGVFSRGLKQRHTVCVSKLLCQVCGHLNGASQVTFISNQNSRYVICQQVLFAFLYPRWQAVEAGHVGHVIHKDDSMHISIVVLNHALPEPLLSCCVPQLDLEGGKQEAKSTSSVQWHKQLNHLYLLPNTLPLMSLSFLCYLRSLDFMILV